MEPELEETLSALVAGKKAVALREELKKPASDRRPREKVIEEVMEDYLFTTEAGTHLDPSNLRRAFHSAMRAAGLKRIRYHDIRRTYATNLLKAGENIPDVSRLLGHSSIQITVEAYGHFLPNKEAPCKPYEHNSPGAQGKTDCVGTLETKSGDNRKEDQTGGTLST